VSELESDLSTATMDLAMTSHRFSQVTNQLQVVTEEATQLRDSKAKLSQDLDGQSGGPLRLLSGLALASCRNLTCRSCLQVCVWSAPGWWCS
jgi:hypothetical protein